METALLAAISMGRDLLLKKNERVSLTKGTRESDPSADGRPMGGPVRLLDLRQDEDGHWVAVLSCGHTQHLRHQPPWQNRPWVLDPVRREAQRGQPFACGWCQHADGAVEDEAPAGS
ncbi:DUF3565 domain-containing protein [Pseudomonas benzenivorans]|uniref:DUF3565 domain-containing protein n=1 Tax=Pseudomonas benzenivorans TaxID=556533 RepID=A0ABY5H675_9PSED|nr:DUF3565 domain-containing protein [Pseudomonas benzenivorans]UTW06917.1 DUF3565 domain-containing protein [Pseudomonas benzenivorans]